MRKLNPDLCADAYVNLMRQLLALCDEDKRDELADKLGEAAAPDSGPLALGNIIEVSMEVIKEAHFAVSIKSPFSLSNKDLTKMWALQDPREERKG